MTTDRVTQAAGKVIVSMPSSQAIRVTQAAGKVIVSTPSLQTMRVTQVALKVIVRRRGGGWIVGAVG